MCCVSLDDGKLSLDEFQAFFSDGTLNEEELEKLFHTIDSDNTRSACARVCVCACACACACVCVCVWAFVYLFVVISHHLCPYLSVLVIFIQTSAAVV